MPSRFAAGGKLTSEDYTHVLAPALEAASAGSGKLRILLDFSAEFDGIEPGAVRQDLRMGVGNWGAWERIALVTDHKWMRDGLNVFSWAVPGQARAFPTADRDAAMEWVAEP